MRIISFRQLAVPHVACLRLSWRQRRSTFMFSCFSIHPFGLQWSQGTGGPEERSRVPGREPLALRCSLCSIPRTVDCCYCSVRRTVGCLLSVFACSRRNWKISHRCKGLGGETEEKQKRYRRETEAPASNSPPFWQRRTNLCPVWKKGIQLC